jgi:hypothetical protein
LRLKYTILVGVTLLAKTAFSQEEPSKVDLYGVYSYLRFNPALPGVQGHNLNGGGGGTTLFLDKYFGVKGELMGYEISPANRKQQNGFWIHPKFVLPCGLGGRQALALIRPRRMLRSQCCLGGLSSIPSLLSGPRLGTTRRLRRAPRRCRR